MELALQAQRPVSCGAISDRTDHFKIKPFLGFFPNGRKTQFSQVKTVPFSLYDMYNSCRSQCFFFSSHSSSLSCWVVWCFDSGRT